MSNAAAPPIESLDTKPAQTQWSIVKDQFTRNRAAMWGLRVTMLLILVAIYAPVIASGEPLLWKSPEGLEERGATLFGYQSPWLVNLFDVNVYESTLDRMFNLIMVSLTLWFVFRGAIALVGRLVGWGRDARQRLRGSIRVPWAVLTLVLCVFQAIGGGVFGLIPLTTSKPRVVYADLVRAYEEHNEALAAHAAAADGTAFRSPHGWHDQGMLDASIVRTMVPYGYREQLPDFEDSNLPAFHFSRGRHILGTDEAGRDVFARLLYGTRISLTVGLVAVAIYVTIGTILGAAAGYFRGAVDMIIMRTVEMLICIPGLFLLLTLISVIPPESRGIFLIMALIGCLSWTGTTRLVRGEFLRERNKPYVEAAQMLGYGKARIIFRHVLPNSLSPVLVTATFGVAGAILTESGLAFLGLSDPTVPSWGGLLNEGRVNHYYHLILPPSVAIFITITALNLIGDGLRDALDPKLRN